MNFKLYLSTLCIVFSISSIQMSSENRQLVKTVAMYTNDDNGRHNRLLDSTQFGSKVNFDLHDFKREEANEDLHANEEDVKSKRSMLGQFKKATKCVPLKKAYLKSLDLYTRAIEVAIETKVRHDIARGNANIARTWFTKALGEHNNCLNNPHRVPYKVL